METKVKTTNKEKKLEFKSVNFGDMKKLGMFKEKYPVLIPVNVLIALGYMNPRWSYRVSDDGQQCLISHIPVWDVSAVVENFKKGFRKYGNSWDLLVIIMNPTENTIRLKVNAIQTDNKMNIRYKVNERTENE